jgi:hypothetical protein
MFPIVIPAKVSRDELFQYYFNKKFDLNETLEGLKTLKRDLLTTLKHESPQKGGAFTYGYVPYSVISQGAKKATKTAAQKLITDTAAPVATEAAKKAGSEALGQVGGIVASAAVGAYEGYQRTGNASGAIIGASTGIVTGVVKATVVNTVANGAYAVTTVSCAPLGPLAPVAGWLAWGTVHGAAVLIEIAITGTTTSATVTGTNLPMAGGGHEVDPDYQMDIQRLTEGADKVMAELKNIMGEEYYSICMSCIQENHLKKNKKYGRVIHAETYLETLGFLCFFIILSAVRETVKVTKTKTRKNKYSHRPASLAIEVSA